MSDRFLRDVVGPSCGYALAEPSCMYAHSTERRLLGSAITRGWTVARYDGRTAFDYWLAYILYHDRISIAAATIA